jgi:Rieske Fe-S protein
MGSTTRRSVLAGAGAAGVALTVAACGKSDSSTPARASGSNPADTAGTGAGAIKASDIPVGGGKVFKDIDTVVTQPVAGQFKAFSARCTHVGCPVSKVENGAIICPCHGSRFSATDGSVQNGPATTPLTAKTVTVTGDTLTVS